MSMETLWFYIVAIMIAVYVILDGFDLGAGVLHLLVARNDGERRTVLQSIGPVWDGNEVWLLAAGGSLVLAFPKLYASAFSGFYLPLMMVLWLLILRAISIEFRSHVDSPVWRPFWDVTFSLSSLLLAVVLGAALGNVVRGVPLGEDGYFFTPLWTSFQVSGEELGILDWYTLTVGLTSLLALTYHGSMWLILKTEGVIRERARRIAGIAWPPLLLLVILVTVLTFRIQPHVPERMNGNPLSYAFPLLALAGIVASRSFTGRGKELEAFLTSGLFLALILVSVVFGLYPMVLPGAGDPSQTLTIHNASAPSYSMRVALFWWIPGMILVTIYTTYVYRQMRGKVRLDLDAY
jgi:cytochrome d ubiquinol oxidase subunit II